MQLLKEEIYLTTKEDMTSSQKPYLLVYVDMNKSENTYKLKEEFKKYNMEYIPYNRYFKSRTKELMHQGIGWGWIVWNGDTDPIWRDINRFKDDIPKIEQQVGDTPRSPEEVYSSLPPIIQQILNDIDKVKNLPNKQGLAREAMKKLEEFENMITNELGNEKTQQFLENLIQYRTELRKHHIYNLGWSNMILVYLATNGEGTQVRPLGEWLKMGYTPKEGAKPISLIGTGCKYIKFTPEEKEKAIQKYLKERGVNSIEELRPSALYNLETRILRGKKIWGTEYTFNYIAYDIKDMVPGEGAETEPEEPDDNWWWANLPEDEKDIELTTALIKFGESSECGNIRFNVNNTRAQLDGARGNATNSGVINLINDGKQRFPTACHELLHQLRHWPVASNNNPVLMRFYDRNPNRDIREQEAELCSAFVCHVFGYDIQPQLNYLYNWGLNKKNVKAVFDKIAEIANFIENGVKNYLSKDNKY